MTIKAEELEAWTLVRNVLNAAARAEGFDGYWDSDWSVDASPFIAWLTDEQRILATAQAILKRRGRDYTAALVAEEVGEPAAWYVANGKAKNRHPDDVGAYG